MNTQKITFATDQQIAESAAVVVDVDNLVNESIIHGTHRAQDLIPAFVAVAYELDQESSIEIPVDALEDDDHAYWASEAASHDLESLFDLLGNNAPNGCDFCAHVGDGSDFGFWLSDDFKQDDYDRIMAEFDDHDLTIEALEAINNGDPDFEVNDYRFIADSDIDQIQQDELSGDLYILGCFNAWFLASVLEIDQDVIESMQASEAFEAVGKLVISLGKLEKLQSEYCSADGYGHHFAHYDHNEHELENYRFFRIN